MARDVGQMKVPPNVLAKWASAQALLIRRTTLNPECQARCAELICQCGGTILDLPVVRWFDKWMNSEQLRSRLRKEDEIIVHGGDVQHDDEDYVPKTLFSTSLILSSEVMFIPSVRGSFTQHEGSHLNRLVLSILTEVWGGYEEELETWPVARVEGQDIERLVEIYRRSQRATPSSKA